MPPLRLFISHAHEDKPLADALKNLIAGEYPPGPTQLVKVDYSSDDSPDGINPGAQWLEWIFGVVRGADVCVVILTADSVTKPWLTWEAGAVAGVAKGTASLGDGGLRKATVVPLLFGIGVDQIPEPLRLQQAVNGERPDDVRKLLYLLERLSTRAEPTRAKPAVRRVSRFVRDVQRSLQARARSSPARLRLTDGSAIHFVNNRYGLTLEPVDGEIANGVRLRCGKFTGDLHQAWHLYPVRTGVYRIVTADTTKCISVQDDSVHKGAPILLWAYEQHETQHWQVVGNPAPPNALSTVRIVNAASKLCLMPRLADRQVVHTPVANVIDEDWWILVAPVLPSV